MNRLRLTEQLEAAADCARPTNPPPSPPYPLPAPFGTLPAAQTPGGGGEGVAEGEEVATTAVAVEATPAGGGGWYP